MPEETAVAQQEEQQAAPPAESAASETEQSAESATAETTETHEGEETGTAEPPKKEKGGVQRRIDELTRAKRLAEAEAEFWKSKAMGHSERAKEKSEPLKEPNPDDYDGSEGRTLADYLRDVRAFDRQENEKLLAQKLAEQKQTLDKSAEQEMVAAEWQERVEAAQTAHADYREVTTAAMETLEASVGPGTTGIASAIEHSEDGPELLYYLGQHPEEAEKISALSPRQAYIAMLRIEARLEHKDYGAEKSAAPQTRAPKPPTPTRKTSPVDTGELRDDLPPEQWRDRFLKKTEKK